jgi:hypothetical protein
MVTALLALSGMLATRCLRHSRILKMVMPPLAGTDTKTGSPAGVLREVAKPSSTKSRFHMLTAEVGIAFCARQLWSSGVCC